MKRFLAGLCLLAACKAPQAQAPAPPAWRWENPRPQGNTLLAVHVGRDKVVYAVGEAGTILRSDDGGATFTSVPSGTRATLTGVTGDGGGVLVVGARGTILSSADGRVFLPMASPTTENLEDVVATLSGRAFAVGDRGTILRSNNGGATWTPVLSGVQITLRAIRTNVQDVNVVVGDAGTILVAEDNAPVWEKRPSGTGDDLLSVWVGGKKDVVVAGGASVVRSRDGGKTFTTANVGRGLTAVGGDAGTLWLGGTGGTLLRSSDVGATWTAAPAPADETFTAIAPGGLLVGTFGTIVAAEGGTAARDPRVSLTAVAACPGGDVYAAGFDGTLLVSRAGGPFRPQPLDARAELTSVACDAGGLVAAGGGGLLLVGDPPLPRPSGVERRINGVALVAGKPVAVTGDGTIYEGGAEVARAPKGLRAVWADGARAVAVGDGGVLYVRGEAGWHAGPTGPADLLAVAGYVAVGGKGTIFASSDRGLTWRTISAPVTTTLLAVAVSGDQVLIAGEDGVILRGPLGGPFTVENSGTANELRGVAIAPGGRQLAVGAGGTILTH